MTTSTNALEAATNAATNATGAGPGRLSLGDMARFKRAMRAARGSSGTPPKDRSC